MDHEFAPLINHAVNQSSGGQTIMINQYKTVKTMSPNISPNCDHYNLQTIFFISIFRPHLYRLTAA